MNCEHCLKAHAAEFWCNERVYAQYHRLVRNVVRGFLRVYRISSDFEDDITQDVLLALLKTPQSYRPHPNGMYAVIRTRTLNTLIINRKIKTNGYLFWSDHAQPLEEASEEFTAAYKDRNSRVLKYVDFAVTLDRDVALRLLRSLPQAERLSLELIFGLNGASEHTVKRTASKLGKTPDWVNSRLNKGLERLRSRMAPCPQAQ